MHQQRPAGEPEFDPRVRPPALSRRGYVAIGLVPVLIAALGFGIIKEFFSTYDPTGGTPIRVPTSDWIPGQKAGSTPVRGVLEVDSSHCVYLDDPATGAKVWPVWPAGYTGLLDEAGHLTLVNGAGDDVAVGGQRVVTTGTMAAASSYADQPCVPEGGQVALVEAGVTTLG